MVFEITPERAIWLTKLSVASTCCWPPPPNASRSRVIAYELAWYACFLSAAMLALPLVYSVYLDRRDIVIMSTSTCLASAMIQVLLKMIVSKMHRDRFRSIFHEMETFCSNATGREREVLQRHVDERKLAHVMFTVSCYLTSTVVVLAPLILPQPFPTHAKYPFPANRHPIDKLVYLHQAVAGYQASGGVSVDCQTGVLLWFLAARFEMLSSRLRSFKGARELNECVRTHQRLLRYANDVHRAVRYMTLVTITTTSVGVAFACVNIVVVKNPPTAKAEFCLVVFSAGAELFMCAWPADALIRASSSISADAYASAWYTESLPVQTSTRIIAMRAQKPETIRIGGVLPALSLIYYTQFIYTTFRYFTAIQVMLR